jgi:hypothetical protein
LFSEANCLEIDKSIEIGVAATMHDASQFPTHTSKATRKITSTKQTKIICHSRYGSTFFQTQSLLPSILCGRSASFISFSSLYFSSFQFPVSTQHLEHWQKEYGIVF